MLAGFDLIGILIALIVLGVIFYLVTLLPLAEPFPTLIKVVTIIVAILWLASKFLK